MSTALKLFSAGKLKEAIAAATEEVRKAPTSVDARGDLADMLLFAGDLERADKQLEAITPSEPKAAYGFSRFRHLVRAEQARHQLFTEGRVPDFLETPSQRLRLLLEATIHLREGRPADANKLVEEALALFPSLSGTRDGVPFQGIRDLDDLLASVFEVIAPNGKYYWIPMESVERIEFTAADGEKRSARDLLWRPALLSTWGGSEGEVFLPAIYHGSHLRDEAYAVGHMSHWEAAGEGGPYRGLGQRTLLFGKEEVPFLEIKEIDFQKVS
jgi:type VI secretion system protein ImpE